MNKQEQNVVRSTLHRRDWQSTKELWRRYQAKHGLTLVPRFPATFTIAYGLKQDEAKVKKVTDKHRRLDMGFLTGVDSFTIVVDVDEPEKFQKFCQENSYSLPKTLTHKTREDKRHYLYRIPKGVYVGGRVDQDNGFDIIGEGQTAPLPMSVHRKTLNSFINIEEDAPIADCPEWVINHAKEAKSRQTVAEYEVEPEDLPVVTIDNLPDSLQESITSGVSEDRSRTAWRTAQSLKYEGLTFEETVSCIWNNEVGIRYHEKPNGYEQLHYMVNKVYGEEDHGEIPEWNTVCLPEREQLDSAFSVLADYASRDLRKLLEDHGNRVTPERYKDLHTLITTYSAMANGKVGGRIAFPLPTGYGKSTSIIAFLNRANDMDMLGEDFTIAITAFKVNELCELHKGLTAQGIPEEMISLCHSYKYDEKYIKNGEVTKIGYASLPASKETNRPILLLTHNKAKSSNNFDKLTSGRTLTIWDESMLSTEVGAVSVERLSAGIGYIRTRAEIGKEPTLLGTVKYLQACIDEVTADLSAQLEGKSKSILKFDHDCDLSIGEILDCVGTFVKEARTLNDRGKEEALRDLITFTRVTMHEASANLDTKGSNHFVVSFDIALPDATQNMVILDASTWINILMQMDETVAIPEGMNPSLSYEGTIIHRMDMGGGWSAIDKEWRTNKHGLLDAVEKIVEKHNGEPILFFTYKERDGVNSRDILTQHLESKGYDIEETVERGNKRFNWLTHGNYTASNQFTHCGVMIFVGVLYKPEYVYATQAIAQTRDLTTVITSTDVTSIRNACHATDIHQGMNRGAGRVIEGNTARPVNVYYTYHNDNLIPFLERVMPRVGHKRCDLLKPKNKKESAVKATVDFINGYDGETISKALVCKKVPELQELSLRYRQEIWLATMDQLPDWKVVGRSLNRR